MRPPTSTAAARLRAPGAEILSDYPREECTLATKVYSPMSALDRGLSRAQIRKQIDASLERLQIDYADLYQCHRYYHDPSGGPLRPPRRRAAVDRLRVVFLVSTGRCPTGPGTAWSGGWGC